MRTATLPQFVRDLLASPPRRGAGLNLWFYRVARVLHPYREQSAIIERLKAVTAGKPVKHGEIERAVERSKTTARQPGEPPNDTSPAWPTLDWEKRDAVIRETDAGLVDLWESSPIRIEDKNGDTEAIIDTLFPGNPLLCAGKNNYDFATRSRSEWRGTLAALQLIVPNPMTDRIGHTQDGRESAHALSITGERRFLVVEQDSGTIDEQAAVLLHLAACAPLTLAVHSGNKSIHGWFFCVGQLEEKLRSFMRYVVSLGADRATWTRSQFVRIPDGTRDNGERQTVDFFNPQVVR